MDVLSLRTGATRKEGVGADQGHRCGGADSQYEVDSHPRSYTRRSPRTHAPRTLPAQALTARALQLQLQAAHLLLDPLFQAPPPQAQVAKSGQGEPPQGPPPLALTESDACREQVEYSHREGGEAQRG